VADLPDLRTVLFAGEVFPTKYLARIMKALSHVEFANLFGPTETNVCTFYRVPEAPPEDGPPVPIGRAIAGVETTVMGDDGLPVAAGEAGELWVRGPTVMQGYWPSRTVAADSASGGYRTGDIVRQTSSGDYEFIGRRDSQIKSRGYRIELGDIEAAMLTHPGILECAIIPVPDDLVTNRITASVVKAETLTEEEIRRYLAELLPKYMVPESFDYLDRLPRTSTGKIDRQRLIGERPTTPPDQPAED
jgi:acyl-coenzyme A synthetase/AMP-(fatty) acid ligase